MDIRKHIKELLFTHDCVIVPGFGGFVTGYQPSEIQRFKNVIYPPSKSLLFNRRLQTNDGVLISRVAQQENMDYKTAEEKIRQSADTWNRQIDNKGMLMFPDIGKLYINSSNALVFLPELRKNYLTDTFGLKPIAYHLITDSPSAKLIKMERKPPPPTEEDFDDNDEVDRKENKKRLRVTLIAAAAVLLMLLIPQLFLQGFLPENLRIRQLNVMPLFESEKAEAPKEKKEMLPSSEEKVSESESAADTTGTSSTETATPEPKTDPALSGLPATGNFYVIFGESDFISDAIRIKKQLDEQHSRIFEVFAGDDGNYVVGLKAGETQEQAEASLTSYRATNNGLKVMVRQ